VREALQTRAFERVAPALAAGERPVVATRVLVGRFGASRIGTVASRALVAEGAGALGALLANSGKRFAVLTDRRLILLAQTFMGGPGARVVAEIPVDQVTLVEAKLGIVSVLRLAIGSPDDGVSFTFPRVDKKNAEALAQALKAPAA